MTRHSQAIFVLLALAAASSLTAATLPSLGPIARIVQELPEPFHIANNSLRDGHFIRDHAGVRLRFSFSKTHYMSAERELAKADREGWTCKGVRQSATFFTDVCEARILPSGELGSTLGLPDMKAVRDGASEVALGRVNQSADGRWYINLSEELTGAVLKVLPRGRFLRTAFVNAQGAQLGWVQETVRTKKILCGHKVGSSETICKLLLLGSWKESDVVQMRDFEAGVGSIGAGSLVGTSEVIKEREGEAAAEELIGVLAPLVEVNEGALSESASAL